MRAATRFLASAAVGSLLVVSVPATSQAQAAGSPAPRAAGVTSFAAGSISGVVQDEGGHPVPGVVISALGASTTVAVTDRNGSFEFGALAPGPYLLRAHLSGYVTPRPQMVQVASSARATSSIALRKAGSSPTVLAAGVGIPGDGDVSLPLDAAAEPEADASSSEAPEDDHSERAWRIRHARVGVLKDALIGDDFFGDAGGAPAGWGAVTADVLGRAMESPARAATSFFVDTPFSGQVNLLTTGSFNTPEQLFSVDNLSRNSAFVSVGAPLGDQADWAIRGALTQADISSWILAGSYTTRAPARHRYDVGLSYSTQRYDGGNVLTLRDVTEGSRNVGTVYGYDSFAIVPAVTVTYGAAYARYDYLNGQSLLSPKVDVTLVPVDKLRVSAGIARRALAPGAEEFLPPGDTGIWLPPQRTFSSLQDGKPFQAERSTQAEVAVERDLGASTLAVRAFHQHVDDQLVTIFGADLPGQPAAKLGHYVVGNAGSGDASGCSAAIRTMIAGRIRGSIEYSLANAELAPTRDVRYLMLLAPSSLRPAPERLQNLATTIETEVPETSTRILILYRVSNGFAHPARPNETAGNSGFDARFDVQVRQSLPFMNFSNARWEMLLAVRNFFREAGTDQSVYDELMVVQPPKRVVGGVTLRF